MYACFSYDSFSLWLIEYDVRSDEEDRDINREHGMRSEMILSQNAEHDKASGENVNTKNEVTSSNHRETKLWENNKGEGKKWVHDGYEELASTSDNTQVAIKNSKFWSQR